MAPSSQRSTLPAARSGRRGIRPGPGPRGARARSHDAQRGGRRRPRRRSSGAAAPSVATAVMAQWRGGPRRADATARRPARGHGLARRRRAALVVSGCASLVSGCAWRSAHRSSPSGRPGPDGRRRHPRRRRRPHRARWPRWPGRPAGTTSQCGSVTVPLDYSHPGGRTIKIAVERRPAADASQRIGSLVINPGGPGTSGIDDLRNELSVLTPGLLDRFDIVSFDPRGVQRSAPGAVRAGAGPDTVVDRDDIADAVPAPLPDPVPVTAAAAAAPCVAQDRAYGEACEKYSDGVLPFVGTVDAARDLDRIRAALGDAKLTFIGHSYGTLARGRVRRDVPRSRPGHGARRRHRSRPRAPIRWSSTRPRASSRSSTTSSRWCASTSVVPVADRSRPHGGARLRSSTAAGVTPLPGADGRDGRAGGVLQRPPRRPLLPVVVAVARATPWPRRRPGTGPI